MSDLIVQAFAVIDTNVIISSMIGDKNTATKEVLSMVEDGNIIPLFDNRMLLEYEVVLKRFFSDKYVEEKLNFFIHSGYLVKDIEQTKLMFKDEDDIPFFEVKESAKELEPYLVTGNTKHFPDETTITPTAVVYIMRYLNRFVIKDKQRYLEEMRDLQKNLNPENYKKIDSYKSVHKYDNKKNIQTTITKTNHRKR